MPYKRGYKKRSYARPVKKSSSYYTHGKNALELALKAIAVATATKKLLNVELKAFNITQIATDIPNGSGTIVQLTNIAQGDSAITRDGQQLKLVRQIFRAEIVMSASATNSMVTVMLVRDNSTNQAIYATSDIMGATTDILSVISPYNFNNQSRFKILKRWIFKLNSASNTSKIIQYFGSPNLVIRYDDNGNTIASLTKNSISLLFISDETTNVPTITFFNRFRYVDN